MGRKILTAALILGMALSGIAFANGQKEQNGQGPATPGQSAQNQGGPGMMGPGHIIVTTGQKLVVTGSVTIHNLIHPVLKSADKSFELLVPRALVREAGVKEGAQVTVEGYQVLSGPGVDQGDGVAVTYLYVTKATIDGKSYDLSQIKPRRGPRGRGGYGYGPQGGMMNGYGPRGMMGGNFDSDD
jgi:hypothetical protein